MDYMDTLGLICILICFVPITLIGLIGSIIILIVDIVRGDRMEDECRTCKYRIMYNDQMCCMNEKSGAYKRPVKPTEYCGAYLWKNAKIKRP